MKLFVDDVRDAPEEHGPWTVVRTFAEAQRLIFNNWSRLEYVSLDHDLGEEKSGYDLMKLIEQRVFMNDDCMSCPQIWSHSANPVGRDNIFKAYERLQELVSLRREKSRCTRKIVQPCPFCNRWDLSPDQKQVAGGDVFCVYCHRCHAEGPWSTNLDYAYVLWNARGFVPDMRRYMEDAEYRAQIDTRVRLEGRR